MTRKLIDTILILSILFFNGCAEKSKAVKIAKNTYLITNQAATGFTGMGKLKAEAFQDANIFCNKLKKSIQFVSSTEAKPPYVLGNFPRVDIQFMCVESTDKDYTHLKLDKDQDVLIQNHK